LNGFQNEVLDASLDAPLDAPLDVSLDEVLNEAQYRVLAPQQAQQ